MKALLVVALLLGSFVLANSQTAEIAFHSASKQYIHEKDQDAKRTLDQALQKYPNDAKLRALRAKIKEDEKKKEEQKKEQEKKDQEKKDQEKKDQEKKDQEKKDQEKKDQEKKDQKDKDPKDQKEKEQKEKEQKEKEEQEKNKDKKDIPPSVSEKLKEMQMSEEKAKMILEAMKNQEVQYLQQNKRKATKPKDKGKPDW
jgi:outer membrane biosynthesis protein TonB